MRLTSLDLTVFSSALFCVAAFVTTPSEAVPQRPWYLAAFDRVLHAVVDTSDQMEAAPSKEAAKQIEQDYFSRLIKEEGTITLKGHVPSESDFRILQGVAAATSPGASVIDKSRVNANVPDRDTWLAAMTFALRQLGKLQSGSAVLRNTAIVIEGVTKADDDFVAVQKKLEEEKPKGVDVRADLKPHEVHPFVWFAQLQAGSLKLSGHVPDKQDEALCAHAQTLFRTLKVSNSMEFAKGEPREWLAATKVALEMLSLVNSGSVEVSDNVIKFDGVSSSREMVTLVRSYSKRLPSSFTLEMNILEQGGRPPAARAEDVNLAAREPQTSMNP